MFGTNISKLFLYDFHTFFGLSKRNPQPSKNAINECGAIADPKHQCARIEKIGIARSLREPQMVEEWEK
jgi:hypothetical protein